MWIDTIIIPIIFLIASSSLWAVRLSLENKGLKGCRKELNNHPKYYSIFRFFQKLDKNDPWSALFGIICFTSQITRLGFVLSTSLYFFNHAYSTSPHFSLCIILFFFPVLLGWQLRQDAKKEQMKWPMDALPIISILVLVFSFVLISEIMRLRKELRKLTKLTRHLKQDIELLKADSSEK